MLIVSGTKQLFLRGKSGSRGGRQFGLGRRLFVPSRGDGRHLGTMHICILFRRGTGTGNGYMHNLVSKFCLFLHSSLQREETSGGIPEVHYKRLEKRNLMGTKSKQYQLQIEF